MDSQNSKIAYLTQNVKGLLNILNDHFIYLIDTTIIHKVDQNVPKYYTKKYFVMFFSLLFYVISYFISSSIIPVSNSPADYSYCLST